MSIEGPGLYQDDTGHDIRSEYRELIGGGQAPDEATRGLVSQWADVLGDEDVYCAFYLALADTQWRLGWPVDSVNDIAIDLIDSGRDIRRWHYSPVFQRKRRLVLDELRSRLRSAPPSPKAVRNRKTFATPLALGDLVRYTAAEGDVYLLGVVGVAENNGARFAVVCLVDWDGLEVPNLKTDVAALAIRADGPNFALSPYRGVDLPKKRFEFALRDWQVPLDARHDSLVGCSLVSWGANLDWQLRRARETKARK